ncbi:TetR/AcrR family transcriptional regulator [Herbiconiux sp. CPCC 205763]|uniref:TetR/AcrR family transcriptional regulator n=1 Tax=Herbiconiux aconitum TaxID=2970913 RepID=A0ABT2GUF0_9MICO|nr:TetR/AcrR family transcriptional regulator [Herbiconiux aconitum]MCS5719192.1 TetR/AcrR family transcriptional regulator [Herbiconiux aconitum]
MTQNDFDDASEATASAAPSPEVPEQVKLGRKRDHTRDPEILEAALDVLAEEGYDGMTIDMVAARAKAGKATLYRRWASKGELVVDAVACMKKNDLQPDRLPDTGTLRGDLVGMIKQRSIADAERKLQIMGGLMSVLSRSPEMSEVIHAAIIEPRVEANRVLLRRALDRGEIAPDCDIDTLALVSPSMASYRTLVLKKPVDREFLISVIDGVILPAAGIRSPSSATA